MSATSHTWRGSVAVFCGAALGHDPRYKELATEVGRCLARHNLRVVYGGSKDGLMGAVASGALEEGGFVLGVLPEKLVLREVAHSGIQQLVRTQNMAERKHVLFSECDVVLMIPGGIGTMDEFFEALTANSLGFMAKTVVVLDAFGFFAPLLNWLESVACAGFCRSPEEMYCILHDIAGLEAFLSELT